MKSKQQKLSKGRILSVIKYSGKWYSGAKEFMKKTKRIGIIVAALLLIILVILFCPQPGVELYINSSVAKENKSAIISLVETALARTRRFVEHKGTLAFTINKSIIDNPIPSMRFENALSFGDAVTIDASIELTGKIGEYKMDFEPNVIIDKVYDVIGVERYYIIVHNYEEKKHGARMLARVYPIDATPQEIPYRGYGKEDEIADKLGHYFLKVFIEPTESSLDRKTHLCLSDMSSNLKSLDLTVEGFNIMFRGRGHPVCTGLSEEECANKMLEVFNKALDEDSDNDHARFGRGLVHLKLARAAIGTKSAYTVGRHLIAGIDELDAVRKNNEFLAALMQSPEWKAMLEGLKEFSDLELSEEFLATASFYRKARQAYVEARYDDVSKLILKMEKRPKWINGHLKALDLSAKMFAANQKKELAALLAEFYKLRDQIDIWVWAPIYGLHLTTLLQNDLSREEEIRDILDFAINTARDQVSVLDATALKGKCVAMLGKHDEAKKYAEQVRKSIGTKVEKRYRSIYLTLAALYTETGDFEEARIFLKSAIKFNIAYLRHVQNSPLFKKFRAHGSYRSFLSEVSPK